MIHDSSMPVGWHQIKSVLLIEICTASNFHLCERAASALFHARLIGEGITGEIREESGGEARSVVEERPDTEDEELTSGR